MTLKLYRNLFFLTFILITLLTFNANGQSSIPEDLSDVKAEQLSEGQIKKLIREAENRNMGEQQLMAIARSRGMPQSEIMKLRQRIMNVRSQMGQVGDGQRTGKNDTMTEVQGPQEALKEQRPTMDSLTKKQRKIFGMTLFNKKELTFAPSLNIATPNNYKLGAGDEIVIDIWGASQENYNKAIKKDGTIQIKNLSPIQLSGLSIEEANRRIKNRLTQIFAGLNAEPGNPASTFMQVSLGQIRSINVTVAGEVRKPGTYTMPSLATVFNAMYVSGGPDTTGTFRNVKVVRDNKTIANLDIYEFLVGGNPTDNITLQDQDIIHVGAFDTRVEIKGKVKRPGYYEMKPGENVKDLIKFAGGYAKDAYQERVKIRRMTGERKSLKEVQREDYENTNLHNGDIIKVEGMLNRFDNRVEIKGAVFRDGTYALQENMQVSDLIQKAGGLREDAFTKRGLIYRKKPDYTTEVIPFHVGDIMEDKDSVNLQPEDMVRINSIFDMREAYFVKVFGEVQNTGKFSYVDDMSLEDLIMRAGGFKESASEARIEVARRITSSEDGQMQTMQSAQVYQFDVSKDLELDDEERDFSIKPFDHIYIRKSPSYQEQELVTLKGEVQYPGQYALKNKDEGISDIIERAGGLTQFAYPKGANLIRLRVRTQEEEFVRQETLEQNQNNEQNQQQNLQENPEQDSLKEMGIESEAGSMVEKQAVGIELDRILNNPGSEYDLQLKAGDVIEVPKKLETVQLSGEVLHPVSVRYQKTRSAKYYIKNAGGFSNKADKDKTYVIYANGSVAQTGSFLGIKNYPPVRPGAEVIVPQKEESRKLSATEIISLSSSVATLSAVILNVLNNLP